MKKIAFCIVGLLALFTSVKSQTNEDRIDKLRNVVPPSPNASGLGKYGEWPVNLYTGLPNIEIPIYTVKGRSLSVPVSVSYHAAGNKVGEVASWTGLGWSLNTGGMISRSVRGYPDEDPYNGYFHNILLYTNQNDLCSLPADVNLAKQHKVKVAKGETDAEQDLYSFNALGKSFKFFFRADGTIVPAPYSKVKITTNFGPGIVVPENVFWTVIFEDGTKLEFGGTGFIETTNNPRYDIGSTYFTTAWQLKKITSADGEEINFTYNITNINQDSYFSQSDFIKYKIATISQGSGGCSDYMESYLPKSKVEVQSVVMLQLATIESELARVEFEQSASAREDLEGGRYLNAIKIFSKLTNTYTARFRFNYNYSQAAASNELNGNSTDFFKKRLKLVSIEKTDINTNLENKWQFVYNPQSLPSRRSFAQDHWGFYNGAVSNSTLLPKFYFYPLPNNIITGANNSTGFNAPNHQSGANREGNSNFAKAEILESIIYPTGGKTNFYFEGNTIPVNEEQFTPATVSTGINLNSLSNPYTNFSEITFTTTVKQNVLLSLDSYISPAIFNDMPSAKVSVSVTKVGAINSGAIASTTGISTYNGTVNFNLADPGTYTVRIATNTDQSSFGNTDAIIASCILYYQQSAGFQLINKNTGGLRLNRMNHNDAINAVNNSEQYFVYENPLIVNPVDIKKMYFTEQEERTCDAQAGTVCDNTVITRNSSTQFSLGDIQGGTVGYGKVTTLYGLNGINGKTVTEFNNDEDGGTSLSQIFPYPPTDSKSWRRGLVLKETSYTASAIKTKETINAYQFTTINQIASFKAGFLKNNLTNPDCVIAGYGCTDSYGDCNIQKICYNTTSEHVKNIITTSIIYDQNGLNPLTTISTNYYDNANNLQPTRMETVDSKGQLTKIITRTPLEKTDINAATPLTAAELAAIDDLVNRNIISPVLQTEQYKAGNLLSRSLITYKNWGGLLLKPEKIKVQQKNNALEPRVIFNAYDNKGNLSEQQKDNDITQAYLYGYGKNYPVAQVIGAGYTTIAALVNQTVLDNPLSSDAQIRAELNNLRTGLANTRALVSTYTYKPLVGVTSETDPNGKTKYYEYDAFNRLILIRDKDNNILKKICYNYAGQPENCTACTNFTPNWQNTTTALRCQQGSCGNTGYQEQEQRDMNVCSPTYNQTKWINAGYNPTACPIVNCIALTSTNIAAGTGYTASYYNNATGITYNLPVSAATGLQPLGSIPEGTYTLTISTTGFQNFGTFYSGCGLKSQSGTSATFFSVPISSTGCLSVKIDMGGI
jgi:YD repeat-containing protein